MIQRFFNLPTPIVYTPVPSGELNVELVTDVIEIEILTDTIEIEIE